MNGCFSLTVTESMSPVSSPETIQLSEEEAEQLAEELKQQLRQGERLAGDTQAIERMVAGPGRPAWTAAPHLCRKASAPFGGAAVPSPLHPRCATTRT